MRKCKHLYGIYEDEYGYKTYIKEEDIDRYKDLKGMINYNYCPFCGKRIKEQEFIVDNWCADEDYVYDIEQ